MSYSAIRLNSLLVAAVLAAVQLLAGPCWAFLPPSYGGSATIPLLSLPLTLDPAHARRESELQLVSLLFDTLYRPQGARWVPHLAAGQPKVAPGGLRWSIRLRSGVLLHDGSTLNARQVAAALERARRGPHAHLFATLKSVRPNGRFIELTLKDPGKRLMYALAAPCSAVALKLQGRWIGSGPYRLKGGAKDRWELHSHAAHFAGRPYIDHLTFRHFRTTSAEVASYQIGATHASFHGDAVFGGRPRHRAEQLRSRGASTLLLAFGVRAPWFADLAFRRALALGIERRRLARLAGGAPALAARYPVSPHLWSAVRKRPRFDRNRAKALMRQAAGRHAELRKQRVSIGLLIDASRVDDQSAGGQIVADLDRIGLSVRLELVPARDFERRLAARAFDLALVHEAPQLARGRILFAGVLARAGYAEAARRCLSARSCRARLRWFERKLPMLPLIHPIRRLHYDARLGGAAFDRSARLSLVGLFWRRKAPVAPRTP